MTREQREEIIKQLWIDELKLHRKKIDAGTTGVNPRLFNNAYVAPKTVKSDGSARWYGYKLNPRTAPFTPTAERYNSMLLEGKDAGEIALACNVKKASVRRYISHWNLPRESVVT